MSDERGIAVLESTMLGAAIVALLLGAAVSAMRIQTAGDLAQESARVAADHAARWGDTDAAAAVARRLVPDADVTTTRRGDRITVAVRIAVRLPAGAVTVTGRAEAVVAPHRSRR